VSDLRIRLAGPHEAPTIRQIEDDAAARFRDSKHAYVFEHAAAPADVYAELAERKLVWMADHKGGAVGFAACEVCPDALHLKELAVRHRFQGQGIGRALVREVAKAARRRKLPAVTLTTFVDLEWNAPWYARLGFQELGADTLVERLRQELEDEYGRGLTDRCAMRLTL